MIVAIIGSREYPDEGEVRSYVATLLPGTVIRSGGARGVDSWGADEAKRLGLEVVVIRPDYQRYGVVAPTVRNGDIVRHADLVRAFWDGESRGTRDAINKALDYGISVHVTVKTAK